jgi:starch synthase (maltosyl-transferring)
VVLEAMAAGKAVIGTDVEGTNELIVPQQTGWIVPPENAQALADALMESIQKPDLTKKFGITGRLRVEQNYTLERTIEAYSRLWSDVLYIFNSLK